MHGLGIKSVFSNVSTFFKDTFTTAWSKVKEVFSKGGKIFEGIKEGIAEQFKKIVNSLIDRNQQSSKSTI